MFALAEKASRVDRPARWRRAAPSAATFLLFSLCLWKFSDTFADVDLWGHLRFGLDALAAGAIPRADPYSFTAAGAPWVNHEWLAEVVYALLYRLGGPPALILFKTAVGLAVIEVVRRELARHGVPPMRSLVPLLPLALACQETLATVRPHLFTLVGFALTVSAIRRQESGNPRALWILPPVYALWANLHGGFLAGAGVLLLWLGARALEAAWRAPSRWLDLAERLRRDGLPVAVSLLATLANPYGLGLWSFLVRTTAVPRPEISEWQPVNVFSTGGAVYLILLALSGGALLAGRRRRPTTVALYLCLALLPLVASRHLPLFALGAVLVAAPDLAAAGERWLGPYRRQAGRLVPALAALAGVALLLMSLPHFRGIEVRPAVLPVPARAVALLTATNSPARLAVDFNWGEYAIWHLGPRVLVSIDGRRETVYPETVYQESLRFAHGYGDWDAVLDGRGADLALVRRGLPTDNLLRLKPGWELVYEDRTCALFAAKGSSAGAELRALEPPDLPDDGVGLAFP